MNRISFTFDQPLWLWLLLLLPVLWAASYRALSLLGPLRRIASLAIRSVLLILLIAALAGLQWVWNSDKVTVIYLLDQSDSIPRAKREVMLNYAIESVRAHRDAKREDRAGLIVFGREAAIEFPPFDDNLPIINRVEGYVGRTDATSIESAMKLAQASFPEDSAKRVVILSDGVETLGDSARIAKSLADAGIGLDVIPIELSTSSEVLVEKIEIPANIRQGQPFETRVVINRFVEPGATPNPVPGKLKVTRRVGSDEQLIVEANIVLDQEINVFPIRDTIDAPAGYSYQAEFIPDDPGNDSLNQNNRSTAFTYVRGKGRVMVIENRSSRGSNNAFVEALQRNQIEVDLRDQTQLFSNMAELQSYDAVILAGVSRNDGNDAASMAGFSDEQISMLVSNTEHFGSGLLMLGGSEAFGAGGWSNTKLEEAMPVDFQIRNDKVEAIGALVMILHASEIARGNYWQKRIGQAAIEVLGPMDYCGVAQYGPNGDQWLWGGKQGLLRVGPNRSAMIASLRNMIPGDMPDFQPTMEMGVAALTQSPASLKHMIIISDGDPTPPPTSTIQKFVQGQIKISTVAVGAHGPAGHQTLKDIAVRTGGTYYVAANASALPKIFQREAMRITKSLIYEPEDGVRPVVVFQHEALQGLPTDLPAIRGFVLTTIKSNPLVEVPIRSPLPSNPANQALLATWTYGLGRTAVFTTDTGERWATEWPKWENYDSFFSQLVRWIMRPNQSDGKFSLATTTSGGKIQVIVNALDEEDAFLNFLDMQALAVAPDASAKPIAMKQVAPGRYVGEFDADQMGSYMINVLPAAGNAPLITSATLPYSDEYRVQKTDTPKLKQIASLTPAGGAPGQFNVTLTPESFTSALQQNHYRADLRPAQSLQDIWPWCVFFGAVALFADVLIRRLAIDYLYPARWLIHRLRTKSVANQEREVTIGRLKDRKAKVSESIDQSKLSNRFESTSEADLTSLEIKSPSQSTQNTAKSKPSSSLENNEESSYTERLLAAKKAAKRKPHEP